MSAPTGKRRGFAATDPETARRIHSAGGKAVSADRRRMVLLGRKGAQARRWLRLKKLFEGRG